MPATLTLLSIYKSAQISLPILKAGFKMMRAHATSGKESEWEKGVQDILGDKVKELLKGRIDDLSRKQLEAVEAPLISFTGLVLQSLVQDVLNTEDFASVKAEFTVVLTALPQRWKNFVEQGIPEAQPLNNADFLAALQASQEGDDSSPAIPPEWLAAFFSQWIQRDIGLTHQREGWHTKLAAAVAPLIGEALSSTLVAEHPVAATAFRESMLRFHTELSVLVKEVITEVKSQGAQSADRDTKMMDVMLELAANQQNNNKESRLAAYKRSLLAAFRPYQELAIDNFAAAEQAAPDIWDIFVHPASSKEHLRPEDMDIAQRETPPRMPAQDLLPLLAQDDYRRTVLLGDPGMGKSTLIQSLVAHLASGRGFSGAAALTGLLPVPLILRDLVPHLPQDQVESWTWDSLLTVFLEKYQRDEAAPCLCDCFKDHLSEFRQHLYSESAIFFLIDGLDEIGDILKRRQIVKCIQDGIRAVSKEARWIITSRVIGYDVAQAESVVGSWKMDEVGIHKRRSERQIPWGTAFAGLQKLKHEWRDLLLPGSGWDEDRMNGQILAIAHGDKEYPEWVMPERLEAHLKGIGTSYFARLPIAKRLYLAPFDDKRQDHFTQRWFQHRHSSDYSKELMREVRAHHHDGVRIISRVPNLLCLMNILKRSGKPLPDGRAALYDAIVQAYNGGIDSAYRLRPVHGPVCPFDPAQRRFLLSLLGAHMQQRRVVRSAEQEADKAEDEAEPEQDSEGTILISKKDIATLLVPSIERLVAEGRVKCTHSATELLDELLHHIASRSGLLIPRSSDEQGETLFGFTHLSFLEFFAAEWLGLEFDRWRNRLARESEARFDSMAITEAELDREFPAKGPIQHPREKFKDFPAVPSWHEPLIFLLESRKVDTSTLLRWLFPRLHNHQPYIVDEDDEDAVPLLPLNAVKLAIKLAQDPEIPIATATRLDWWRILWSAYLVWPRPVIYYDPPLSWPIAPLLLQKQETQAEAMACLVDAHSQLPEKPIFFVSLHNSEQPNA